ncbi:Schizosaccharomyces pombe specific protein [Schizosaccharomyces pombe]|uniref:Uncharacterized protein SPCC4G3.20 n=1 Tax=Schizosaccharomyces pombe (strain 972 / ATCC 24843) TaxID=284812 RepID=YC0K_SCHPO
MNRQSIYYFLLKLIFDGQKNKALRYFSVSIPCNALCQYFAKEKPKKSLTLHKLNTS